MLKCRDVSEMETDYAEGALPAGRKMALRLHLLLCGMCRAYFDQMAKTRRFLGGRPLAAPPAEVEDRILAGRSGNTPGE